MPCSTIDGSHIVHFNWMPDEPNKFYEKCIAMASKDGEWTDIECNSKITGICQGGKVVSNKGVRKKPRLDPYYSVC